MRALMMLPMLALAACQVTKDEQNDTISATYNEDLAENAASDVGNFAENLGHVSKSLDQFPNMHVEIAARIGELGRQPRTARRFFDRYQDRILFGTDAVPKGYETPQQIFGDELYKIYYRFLETEDEYFDYAPAPVPPQGRWRIYGLNLPPAILTKVYHDNAARLLGIPALSGD